jgi:hypothetical protein
MGFQVPADALDEVTSVKHGVSPWSDSPYSMFPRSETLSGRFSLDRMVKVKYGGRLLTHRVPAKEQSDTSREAGHSAEEAFKQKLMPPLVCVCDWRVF